MSCPVAYPVAWTRVAYDFRSQADLSATRPVTDVPPRTSSLHRAGRREARP